MVVAATALYYITSPVAIDTPCASILTLFMFLQVMTTYTFCAAFMQVNFSIIHLQRAAQTIQNIAIEVSI